MKRKSRFYEGIEQGAQYFINTLTVILLLGSGIAGTYLIGYAQEYIGNAVAINSVEESETLADQIDSTAYMGDDYKIYQAYENGKSIYAAKFSDADEQFLNGYTNYELYLQGQQYSPENRGVAVSYTQPESAKYDRSELMQKVIDTFGTVTEDDDTATVVSTGKRIRDRMKYSKEYLHIPLDRAIKDGSGVCWHFARIGYVLLNAEGIPTRISTGMFYGGWHAWNECYIDGTWQIVDYTNFEKGFAPADELGNYQYQPYIDLIQPTLPSVTYPISGNSSAR